MKIEQRTCKYQYKTYLEIGHNEFISRFGFINKDINPNAERAFVCLAQLKEHKKLSK
jgi:hypothetical protein